MDLPFQRLPVHATVFYSTTAITCATQSASIAIAIVLATSATKQARTLKSFEVGAAALDILTLLSTAVACGLYLRRISKKTIAICCGLMMLLAVAASVLTGYTFIRFWTSSAASHRLNDLHKLATAGIVTWAIATVFQGLFYFIILRPETTTDWQYETEAYTPTPLEVQSIKRSVSVRMAILNMPAPATLGKTRLEPIPDDPNYLPRHSSSLRHSVNQAMKPMTSRTRLIRGSSFESRHSRSLRSSREERREDDFENWDTSGVEESMDTLFTHRPSTITTTISSSMTTNPKTRLEPIPGSRPVSPAKALDGPFDNAADPPQGSISMPQITRQSPSPSPSPPAQRNPSRSRASSSDRGRQSHIHPLFRTASPTPPPVASPGTIITASPYAGRILSASERGFHPSPAGSAAVGIPMGRVRSSTRSSRARRDSGNESSGILSVEAKESVEGAREEEFPGGVGVAVG